MAIWYNSTTGKVQAQGGLLLSAERSALDNCCCPAPCDCPEGLSETYVLLAGSWFNDGGAILTTQENIVLTGEACSWAGAGSVVYDGIEYEDWEISLFLDDIECVWRISPGILCSPYKDTGNTPVGRYTVTLTPGTTANAVIQ